MADNPALKDFYDATTVRYVAAQVAAVHPLDVEAFIRDIVSDFVPLPLLARAQRITQQLRAVLPADYPVALSILSQSFGHTVPVERGSTMASFRFAPFLYFVQLYGLAHPELSLQALHDWTRYFSAEFAIRPYLQQHTALTFKYLRQWQHDPDWNVRRLVSEGTRPRLPWGLRLQAFVQDPGPCLPLLDQLCTDPSEDVRRSVANHLNDIAKDHPDLAVQIAITWQQAHGDAVAYTIRHGLRTLVKQGHSSALALLGFVGSQIHLLDFALDGGHVRLGHQIGFRLRLQNGEAEASILSIDYAVHHLRANGQHNRKVFKLAKPVLQPGETFQLSKAHKIVPLSTRRYYAGLHRLELLVNGQSLGVLDFGVLV